MNPPEVRSGKLGMYFPAEAPLIVSTPTDGRFLGVRGLVAFDMYSTAQNDSWDRENAKSWLVSAKNAWRFIGKDIKCKAPLWESVTYGLAIFPRTKEICYSGPKELDSEENLFRNTVRSLSSRGFSFNPYDDCVSLGARVNGAELIPAINQRQINGLSRLIGLITGTGKP